MNIKYISLLSLFCAVAISAEQPVAIKQSHAATLDLAKKVRNECLASQIKRGHCDSEETKYAQAKGVFTDFNAKKALEKQKELEQNRKKTIITKKEYREKILIPSFEHAFHKYLADFGLESEFDDYDGSLENFFVAKVNLDYFKDNLEKQLALKEASENVIQSFQEQSVE